MLADNERARLTKLFTETLAAFCRVGLEGQIATKVDALIGITFENNEVLLIKVDECLTTDGNLRHHCKLDKSNSDRRGVKVERVSESNAELESGTDASGRDSDCYEKRSGDRSSCKRKLLDIDLHAVEENWQQPTGHGDAVKADGSKCRDCVEIDLGSLDLDLDCTNVDSTYFVENEPTSRHVSKRSRRASSGKTPKLAACRRSKAASGSVVRRRNSLQKNETETSNAESAQPSVGPNYTIGNKNVQLTAELVSTFIEELPDVPDSVRCKLCGMQGGRAYMLRDHVNGVHLLPRRYSCQHCGQNFKWRSSLYRHRTLCTAPEHLVSVNDDAGVGDSEGCGGTAVS